MNESVELRRASHERRADETASHGPIIRARTAAAPACREPAVRCDHRSVPPLQAATCWTARRRRPAVRVSHAAWRARGLRADRAIVASRLRSASRSRDAVRCVARCWARIGCIGGLQSSSLVCRLAGVQPRRSGPALHRAAPASRSRPRRHFRPAGR
jgi:hypothetical protein